MRASGPARRHAADAMRVITAALQRAKVCALAEPALTGADGRRLTRIVERETRRQLGSEGCATTIRKRRHPRAIDIYCERHRSGLRPGDFGARTRYAAWRGCVDGPIRCAAVLQFES